MDLIMLKKKKSKNHAGSSLIEIVIAIGVVGLVLTGIIASLTFSVKSTSESKYRSLATAKAQEVIELFRRERGRLGWNEFNSIVSHDSYCFDEIPGIDVNISTKQGTCGEVYNLVVPGAGIALKREAEITRSTDSMVVKVSVYWPRFDQGSENIDRKVVIQQEFKNW
jgi:type II secretory pathway pseudopilin PulG